MTGRAGGSRGRDTYGASMNGGGSSLTAGLLAGPFLIVLATITKTVHKRDTKIQKVSSFLAEELS